VTRPPAKLSVANRSERCNTVALDLAVMPNTLLFDAPLLLPDVGTLEGLEEEVVSWGSDAMLCSLSLLSTIGSSLSSPPAPPAKERSTDISSLITFGGSMTNSTLLVNSTTRSIRIKAQAAYSINMTLVGGAQKGCGVNLIRQVQNQ